MNTIALPRIQLAPLPKSFEWFKTVANNASTQLSYGQGVRALHDRRLLEVLALLNALPFEPKSVSAYMRKMSRTNRMRLPWNYRYWRHAEMGNFLGEIPADVLNLALNVSKEYGSGVNFGVDYFSKEAREYDCDPFLTVSVDFDHRHYIAVWDEPGFALK